MLRTLTAVLALALAAWAETAAGVKWTMPKGWTAEAPRQMRAATYRVPAAAGDAEAGECGVYFFGSGQGGTVEANLDRWTKQFEPAAHPPKITKETINGLSVTRVDVSGTYTGAGGPMATAKTAKPGYRLLGAVVEAPEGLVFFKFTGPAKTVTANQAAFQGLLKSLSR